MSGILSRQSGQYIPRCHLYPRPCQKHTWLTAKGIRRWDGLDNTAQLFPLGLPGLANTLRAHKLRQEAFA